MYSDYFSTTGKKQVSRYDVQKYFYFTLSMALVSGASVLFRMSKARLGRWDKWLICLYSSLSSIQSEEFSTAAK